MIIGCVQILYLSLVSALKSRERRQENKSCFNKQVKISLTEGNEGIDESVCVCVRESVFTERESVCVCDVAGRVCACVCI